MNYFKKISIFVILILASLTHLRAQEQYLNVTLFGGVQAVSSEKATLFLNYVDESPTPDFLNTSTTLEEGSLGAGVHLGFEGGVRNGYHLELVATGTFGKATRLGGDVGIGYNFSLGEKFTLRPVLGLAFGSTRVSLGEMQNRSTWIEVNSVRFYDRSVTTSLRAREFGIRPRLDIVYKFNDRFDIKLFAGYFLGLGQTTPFIHFSGNQGENNESGSITAREKVTESNVGFFVDSEETTDKLPVKFNGLQFGLGVSYNIAKK